METQVSLCAGGLSYFLLFGNDKAQLQQWRNAVMARLAQLRLTLHETKAQVRPASEGVGFLGFFLYPTHRRLRSCKGIAFQRKLGSLLRNYQRSQPQRAAIQATIEGWINHVRYGDTWGLRRAVLQGVRL